MSSLYLSSAYLIYKCLVCLGKDRKVDAVRNAVKALVQIDFCLLGGRGEYKGEFPRFLAGFQYPCDSCLKVGIVKISGHIQGDGEIEGAYKNAVYSVYGSTCSIFS